MEQPPSSSSASCGNYDVFLSFSEDEVGKNFVDHLYSALKLRGIHTFKDDDKLKRGKSISPAIENSYIAIVIFSQHYAESTRCLEELVKIMECMKVNGLVVPIFYDVDPSTVRKQKGKFAEAFAEHEMRFEKEKVKKWREVLEEVAKLSGRELKTENGYILNS
nr:TMV resistance protein N-like [Ipomoea batatas]